MQNADTVFLFSLQDIFIGICILCILIIGAFLAGKLLRHRTLKEERSDAVGRSRSVILGEVYEKILPLLPECPYAPRDMVFIGKWVDYIVFDGLSEGALREIVFLEIKTGKSGLNKNEQMIRSVVRENGVIYREWRK